MDHPSTRRATDAPADPAVPTFDRLEDLTTLVGQLAALGEERGTADAEAHLDGTGVRVTVRNGGTQTTLAGGDTLLDQLTTLAEVGTLASLARTRVVAARRAADEDARAARRVTVAQRYATGDAATFGLVADAGGAWRLPEGGTVTVTRTDLPPRRWTGAEWAAALEVAADGLVVGQVRIDVDDVVSTHGAYATDPTPDGVDPAAARTLAHTNPWRDYSAPDGVGTTGVLAHVRALAAVAPQVADWVCARGDLAEQHTRALARREEERKEWGRRSRSKDRIPTGALNDWMAAQSHVTYDSAGLATGGWRVAAEPIVGQTRPRHLDGSGRRRPAVGVKELLYVARLVHVDATRRRQRMDHMKFYDSDVTRLREALPGCVVRVPEDRQALFVAFDAPEYVEAMDAALVEWVLMGDGTGAE